MTRHCYTIKPAVSEGRSSSDYGFTRLSQDEPVARLRFSRWSLFLIAMASAIAWLFVWPVVEGVIL